MTVKNEAKWLLLAGLAFLSVVVFQHRALWASYDQFVVAQNIGPIIDGYHKAQIEGTAQWWYGPWIHQLAAYWRPLSSFVHYGQVWTYLHIGIVPVTLFNMACFALLGYSTALLAYLLTARKWVAIVAMLLVTSYWPSFWKEPTAFIWLAYFPLVDNMLCASCQVLSVCAFIWFLRSGNNRAVLATWAAFLLSSGFKEHGFITPALLAVMCVLGVCEKRVRIVAACHIGFMMAASYLLYKYSFAVTNSKGRAQFSSEFWLLGDYGEQVWKVLLIGALVAFSVLAIIHAKELNTPLRRMGVLFGFLCAVALSLMAAPRHGMPPGVFGGMIAYEGIGEVAVTVAIMVATILGWHYRSRFSRVATAIYICASCALVASLPAYSTGVGMNHTRILLIMPFLVIPLASVLVALTNRLSRRTHAVDVLDFREGESTSDRNDIGHLAVERAAV